MSSGRRTPADTAAYDQLKARARQDSADLDTLVLVDDDVEAGDGRQCCWCDCIDPDLDPASPHRTAGFECGGCGRDAEHVVRLWFGRPEQQNFPLCEAHHRDATRFFARTLHQSLGGPEFTIHGPEEMNT